MWRLPDDNSKAVITAAEQIQRVHHQCHLNLPDTAIVFFMGKGTDYLVAHYHGEEMPEVFPRFLDRCPIWKIEDLDLCFLDGGRGAPQAADTVEILAALHVKNIIAVGMCGGFSEKVRAGEIVVPDYALIEEGTSLHYFENVDTAYPDSVLSARLAAHLPVSVHPITSTDAVYRQTFRKEAAWRARGAVGVDMETSAVFSVAKYYGLKAAAMLMVSDVHPLDENAPKWEWHMTREMRYHLAEQAIIAARLLKQKEQPKV